MRDSGDDALRCRGGPCDGELLQDWQRPDDTYVVYDTSAASTRVRDADSGAVRMAGKWASDGFAVPPLELGWSPMGHYRLAHEATATVRLTGAGWRTCPQVLSAWLVSGLENVLFPDAFEV